MKFPGLFKITFWKVVAVVLIAMGVIAAIERYALGLGATKADHQPGTTFRVFLDPAGHPFCLCTS